MGADLFIEHQHRFGSEGSRWKARVEEIERRVKAGWDLDYWPDKGFRFTFPDDDPNEIFAAKLTPFRDTLGEAIDAAMAEEG